MVDKTETCREPHDLEIIATKNNKMTYIIYKVYFSAILRAFKVTKVHPSSSDVTRGL